MRAASQPIQLIVRKGISEKDVAALARDLRRVGAVEIREDSFGPQMNAFELVLPAFVIILVAKPYCEGFFKELGADTARALRTTLSKLIERLKTRQNRWVTSTEIRDSEKKSETNRPRPLVGRLGPILSIKFQLEHTKRNRYSIKCVFPHDLSDDDVAMALKLLPRDVRAAAKQKAPKLPAHGFSLVGDTYFYDAATGQWRELIYSPPRRIAASGSAKPDVLSSEPTKKRRRSH